MKVSSKLSTSTRRNRRSIAHDADGDEAPFANPHGVYTTAQVLKKVVIPASRSSLGSSLSSLLDQSSDGDTPETSVAVTPAESVPTRGRTHPVASIGLTQSSLSKGKRRRTAEDDLIEADEMLAQTLQEQEWEEGLPRKSAPKRQRAVVFNSDDDDTSASINVSGIEKSSDDDGTPLMKRRRTIEQSRLPSRKARDSAQKLLASRRVLDSEDDDGSELSDVSDFALGMLEMNGLDDTEGSEDTLDEAGVAVDGSAGLIHADGGTPTSQTAAGTATRRRQRRGRHARSENLSRRNRWDGMEDRAVRERKKLEKAHPEIQTMWDDLRDIALITTSQAQQPSTITRKLKSFQLEGLDWMIRQERSQWKGGLLGDEMGMGKTIQAVSLIMSDYPAQDPTLVVVPPVALMQWQNEIEQYTDGKLKVLVYHNTNPNIKNLKVKDLRRFDVIMISYSGLESIYRKESKGWKRDDGLVKENSKIHAIKYHRLILDEAHNIKTRTTSVAKACCALKADFKWCLSGTPVQNRIGEFFSLLRFLEVRPFASYFCKKCPCAELHWSQDTTKRCASCQHSGFEHVSIFNQELLNPITQQGDPDLRREALQKLRLITDRIMLRRMKRDHTASMELPPKEVILHNEFFGEIERDFSSSIMSNTARQFDTYVSRGVMLNNYANIFGLIMQVRNTYDSLFVAS